MSKCWICDNPSETREHRIKKSDLVSMWGKGPYIGDSSLIHFRHDHQSNLQGPDSKLIKFDKNLCAECNSARTQPFDHAYEEFIAWIDDNEDKIIKQRVIDYNDVYGADAPTKQRDLFKFFVKCLGCRLHEAGYAVPKDMVELLDLETFTTGVKVSFQVNEDMLLLPKWAQGIGTDAVYHHSNTKGETAGYSCGHHYRWLRINYMYLAWIEGPIGAPWVADSLYIYLGWHKPLDQSQRTDLLMKLETASEESGGPST